MKIGILIHPGWSASMIDGKNHDYGKYLNYIKEFDKTYVFLPKLSKFLQEKILNTFSDELVKFYFNKKYNHAINVFFNLDNFKHSLDSLTEKSFNIERPVKVNGKVIGTFTKKPREYIYKQFIENFYKDVPDYSIFKTIFNGHNIYHKETKAVVDLFEVYKDSEDVTLAEFGGVGYINLFITEMLNETNVSKDDEIFIFGEFFNQCVYMAYQELIKNGYNVKPIKEYSIYNTHNSVPNTVINYKDFHIDSFDDFANVVDSNKKEKE